MWCSYQACRDGWVGMVGSVGVVLAMAVLGGRAVRLKRDRKSQKAAGRSRRPSEVSASLWRLVPKAKPPKVGGW